MTTESEKKAHAIQIQRLIETGQLAEKDLPALVLNGLNRESVDYYFEHYKNKKEGKMSDTQSLIDKLTSAISFKFKEDTTSPNLTISRLKHGYYCSVIRYTDAFAKGKVVVCKARADNLDDALKGVAQEFLKVANVSRDPLQELGEVVRGN